MENREEKNIRPDSNGTQPGGLTEAYLDVGTYVKSFYTVMLRPRSVKIGALTNIYSRLNRSVRWGRTVPCLVRERLIDVGETKLFKLIKDEKDPSGSRTFTDIKQKI